MEININCDLGEKSKHHSNKNDPNLLEIVNSANVACGYHAGDDDSMKQVVQISKKNGVSIGAHPSFKDPENFGRKRINLSDKEINKLIIDQINILSKIAKENSINKNDSVLIIDDLIATGGTAAAAAKLIEMSKGNVAAFIFVINLFDLGGSDDLIKKNYSVENLIDFPGH